MGKARMKEARRKVVGFQRHLQASQPPPNSKSNKLLPQRGLRTSPSHRACQDRDVILPQGKLKAQCCFPFGTIMNSIYIIKSTANIISL